MPSRDLEIHVAYRGEKTAAFQEVCTVSYTILVRTMLAHSGLWLNLSDSQFHLNGICEHGAESFLGGIYVVWCVNQDGHNHYTSTTACLRRVSISWVTTGNLWVQQLQGGLD